MSGATIILNNNDYVHGAVWTCYTLWHWANGDIYSIIRNITGEHLSTDNLIDSLGKENKRTQVFALEQINRRQNYEPKVIEVIKQNASSNDYELTKLTIKYFENASSEIYSKAMEEVLKKASQKQRLQYLNSILRSTNPQPKAFYESLSLNLIAWNDYPSINLFFKILENKNAKSSSMIEAVIPLLDNESFIITRRAYWFLSELELSEDVQEKLDDFYKKYADSL